MARPDPHPAPVAFRHVQLYRFCAECLREGAVQAWLKCVRAAGRWVCVSAAAGCQLHWSLLELLLLLLLLLPLLLYLIIMCRVKMHR